MSKHSDPSKKEKTVVAAFDFDGTITTKDTLVTFLEYLDGKLECWGKLITMTPTFIGFGTGMISRQQVKEALITRFFGGYPLELLEFHGYEFARSEALAKLMRKEAMERIAWHHQQNHRLVLVSAGIGPYIAPWGLIHGFDDVLCSHLEVNETHEITGKLVGMNCRGPEKVKRLEELLGPREDYVLYAYGNSDGDKELLEYADFPAYKKMSH